MPAHDGACPPTLKKCSGCGASLLDSSIKCGICGRIWTGVEPASDGTGLAARSPSFFKTRLARRAILWGIVQFVSVELLILSTRNSFEFGPAPGVGGLTGVSVPGLGYEMLFVFVVILVMGYYSSGIMNALRVQTVSSLVTWTPVLLIASPSFASNSLGPGFTAFFIVFYIFIFFSLAIVASVLGSALLVWREEFAGSAEQPVEDLIEEVRKFTDDELIEEYAALKSGLLEGTSSDSDGPHILAAMEEELARRRIQLSPSRTMGN